MARKTLPEQQPVCLFSLFALKDTLLYEEFEKHLSPLRRRRLISLKSVGEIPVGMSREAAIKDALYASQIILCFLSPDFIDSSDYTFVTHILQQQPETSRRIVPICLRPVFLRGLPLDELQVLPRDRFFVTQWPNQDEAFLCIAEELCTLIEEPTPLLATDFVVTNNHLSYLYWLIRRLSCLHIQSTHPQQSSFQIKLEKIYIPPQVKKEDQVSSKLMRNEEKQQAETVPSQPFSDVALAHYHLLLLGEPGSGKTVCLRALALKQAQALCDRAEKSNGDYYLPILLRLTDYVTYGAHQHRSLREYLAEDCKRHGYSDPQLTELLESALRTGNALILLDGLDEVEETVDRLAVVQAIEDFLNQQEALPNHIIITSRQRTDEIPLLRNTFVSYSLCQFNQAQISLFLHTYYSTASTKESDPDQKQEPDTLLQAIQNDPAIGKLAANPLFLSILARLHQAEASLPQQRAGLYAQAIATLMQESHRLQETAKERSTKVLWFASQPFFTDILMTLAHWLRNTNPGGIVGEHDVAQLLESTRITWYRQIQREDITRHILQEIASHTGLLLEDSPGHYRFAHLTFEEYFAACYIVAEKQERATTIRRHLHKVHWQEPILLALGLISMESPEEVHLLVESALLAKGKAAKARGITPSPYEYLLGRDFLFALRCLGDDIPVPPALAEHLIERLYNELAYHTGSGRFTAYQTALAERWRKIETSIYAPLLLSHILKGLSASKREIHFWLIYRLRDIAPALREKEPVFQRLQEALDDENSWVRGAALQSLHDLNHPGLRDILLKQLQNDRDRSVQEKALQHLSEYETRTPHLTEVLLQVLRQTASDPTGHQLQRSIVEALGQFGDPSPAVISALIASSSSSSGVYLDHFAFKSLRTLSYQSSEVVPMIIEALRTAPEATHYQAIHELQTFDLSTQRAAEAFLFYLLPRPHALRIIHIDQLLEAFEGLSPQAEVTLQQYLLAEATETREAAFDILCAFDLSEETFQIMRHILWLSVL